jgi:hypothetical protein
MRAFVLLAFVVVGCGNGSSSSTCTLKGTGTASITSSDVQSSWFTPPATTDCSSGARITSNAGGEREADFSGTTFRLFVRLRTDDTGTGVRAPGGLNLAPGTAGIDAYFYDDAGTAAEYNNLPDAGTVTITSNGGNPGDTLAGSFDGIRLNMNGCSVGTCPTAPDPVTIAGTFSAKY